MLDPTPAVTRAMEIAQRWASFENSGEVHPHHLLQGLLQEEEGRPWLLLTDAGLEPEAIRRQLPLVQVDASPEEANHSRAVHRTLRRAQEMARDLCEGSVASEHVLLALLELDVELRRTLELDGLQFGRLQTAIEGVQGPPIQLDEPLLLDEPAAVDETADVLAPARILDASANRAREALRVLEDHARFVLDDSSLTGQLKRLRHDLATALYLIPADLLLQARDTDGDVGTGISTAAETHRGQARDVVQAACKRLQEALRSLEEYGKVFSADFAAKIEALRYRAYTLERDVLLGGTTRSALAAAQLYVLVSTSSCQSSLAETVRAAVAGGAQMIQLRDKEVNDRALLERARALRLLTRQAGVLFIVNDRPDIARLVGADGVHLGQDDLPVREARHILGPDALIGVSTHNLAQLRQAVLDGASYVGIGPTFASATKGFEELAGLDFVSAAAAEVALPAFAIGGISIANAAAAVAAGARRIAVSAAVCQANDPRAAAAALRRILKSSVQDGE